MCAWCVDPLTPGGDLLECLRRAKHCRPLDTPFPVPEASANPGHIMKKRVLGTQAVLGCSKTNHDSRNFSARSVFQSPSRPEGGRLEQGQRSPEPSAQGSHLPWHPPAPKGFGPQSIRRESLRQSLVLGERKAPRRLKVRPLPVGPWAREVECHSVPRPPSGMEILWAIPSPAFPAYLTGLL